MNQEQIEALEENYPCCGCGKCIGVEEMKLLLTALDEEGD